AERRLPPLPGHAVSPREGPPLAVELVEYGLEQEPAAKEALLDRDLARLDLALIEMHLDRRTLADDVVVLGRSRDDDDEGGARQQCARQQHPNGGPHQSSSRAGTRAR